MEGILNPVNIEYLKSLRPRLDRILKNVSEYAEKNDVPIISHEVGMFLELVTLIKNPENVLEIGTAIGFSGIFIARALKIGGRLVTIEKSVPSSENARENFTKAGLINKIEIISGDALKILPTLEIELIKSASPRRFDMAFIDGQKEEYKKYLQYVVKLMNHGGVIIIDNLLWHGQAAGGQLLSEKHKESTDALRRFNRFFLKHPALISSILPIGDGTGFAIVK